VLEHPEERRDVEDDEVEDDEAAHHDQDLAALSLAGSIGVRRRIRRIRFALRTNRLTGWFGLNQASAGASTGRA
jgi:hypothetical protein